METAFLTADELAKELKISKWLVYELTKKDKLPHVKFGRTIRYYKNSVIEYLNNNKLSKL